MIHCNGDEEDEQETIQNVKNKKRNKRKVTIQEPSNEQRHHAKHNVTKIPYREVSLGEFVGRGSYGVVFQAKWQAKHVAVKYIGVRLTRKDYIPKEVILLSKVKHENIITFYGYSEHCGDIYLLMEYADCGSLYDIIHRHHLEYGSVEYTPAHVMNWALQTAEAVEYLHSIKPRPIIHRDLKPSNILLTSYCEVVKICDFGEARIAHTEMTNCTGTPLWMAPEVIEGTKYTEKCDVYSFGIILWEMLARKKPFYDLEVEGQGIFLAVYKGLRPAQLHCIPQALSILIKSCWDEYAKDRPSFTELVRFLRQAFRCVHEGDEELFNSILSETDKASWEVWSNQVIQLEISAACESSKTNDEHQQFEENFKNSFTHKGVEDRDFGAVLSPPRSSSKHDYNRRRKETFQGDENSNTTKWKMEWWVTPLVFVASSFLVYLCTHRGR